MRTSCRCRRPRTGRRRRGCAGRRSTLAVAVGVRRFRCGAVADGIQCRVPVQSVRVRYEHRVSGCAVQAIHQIDLPPQCPHCLVEHTLRCLAARRVSTDEANYKSGVVTKLREPIVRNLSDEHAERVREPTILRERTCLRCVRLSGERRPVVWRSSDEHHSRRVIDVAQGCAYPSSPTISSTLHMWLAIQLPSRASRAVSGRSARVVIHEV
jgi:hypothetical protein